MLDANDMDVIGKVFHISAFMSLIIVMKILLLVGSASRVLMLCCDIVISFLAGKVMLIRLCYKMF